MHDFVNMESKGYQNQSFHTGLLSCRQVKRSLVSGRNTVDRYNGNHNRSAGTYQIQDRTVIASSAAGEGNYGNYSQM
jgi:hypothetical protein